MSHDPQFAAADVSSSGVLPQQDDSCCSPCRLRSDSSAITGKISDNIPLPSQVRFQCCSPDYLNITGEASDQTPLPSLVMFLTTLLCHHR
jgi:hypothetical protein